MKSLYAIAFLLVLSSAALAEQKLNVNIPGGGAQDLLNMTTIPSTISDHSRDYSIIRSCTNAEGRIIYQGSPEYRHCIATTEHLKGVSKSKGTTTPAGGSNIIRIQAPAQEN